jgi:hypothetical protein
MKMKIIALIHVVLICEFLSAQSEDQWRVRQLEDGTLELTSVTRSGALEEIPATLFGLRVTRIGSRINAFMRGRNLSLSEGITHVASSAFYNFLAAASSSDRECTISLPNSLKSIGQEAFKADDIPTSAAIIPVHLKTLGIPRSVEYIGAGAFEGINIDYLKIENGFTVARTDSRGNRKPVFGGLYTQIMCIEIPSGLSSKWLECVFSDSGFRNFYISQGHRAGIYVKSGQIWRTGSRQDVENISAGSN